MPVAWISYSDRSSTAWRCSVLLPLLHISDVSPLPVVAKSITAWRITQAQYQDTSFSGEGAKRYGGRFNSTGVPVVYTAESIALATLELLVRVNQRTHLNRYVRISVRFSRDHVTEPSSLPEGWDAHPYGPASQAVGDEWALSQQSLVLKVPSVVEPMESNYLINPLHPDYDALEIGHPTPLQLDARLLSD